MVKMNYLLYMMCSYDEKNLYFSCNSEHEVFGDALCIICPFCELSSSDVQLYKTAFGFILWCMACNAKAISISLNNAKRVDRDEIPLCPALDSKEIVFYSIRLDFITILNNDESVVPVNSYNLEIPETPYAEDVSLHERITAVGELLHVFEPPWK